MQATHYSQQDVVNFNAAENATSYIDTTAVSGQTYYYRVKAINVVGDTFDYTVTNPQAVGFETMTAESTLSNTASTSASTALVVDKAMSWYWNGDTNATSSATGDVDGDGQTEIVTVGILL